LVDCPNIAEFFRISGIRRSDCCGPLGMWQFTGPLTAPGAPLPINGDLYGLQSYPSADPGPYLDVICPSPILGLYFDLCE
jgi:hypothetical protein